MHVGTNDVGRKQDGVLQSECRDLGKMLKPEPQGCNVQINPGATESNDDRNRK